MNKNANLIERIYTKANLSVADHSVDKIHQIKEVLPNVLIGSTKKNIVCGMLDVMKMDTQEILADANTRVKALTSALAVDEEETGTANNIDKQSIADLESQINKLRVGISTRVIEHKERFSIISDELDRVNKAMNLVS
jgi:hypothetical protein